MAKRIEQKNINLVHQNQIMTETIKKELKHLKLMTKFGYNSIKPSKFKFCAILK